MDVNDLLCVGRTDMYRYDAPKQQFYPMVSSFQMDSLRGSVRKDKPESRSSSRRSSGSPNSPSKSILRGPNGTPIQGSPTGNRNVRFRDGRERHGDEYEYSRLHVNETTQTNGAGDQSYPEDRVVQVYNASDREGISTRSGYSSTVDEGFRSQPVSSSTPRSARERSPINYGNQRNPDYGVRQRELPRPPVQKDGYNRSSRGAEHQPRGAGRGGYDRSPSRSPTRQRQQTSLSTQTPTAPNGKKIIQNMGVGTHFTPREFVRDPRRTGSLDGHKIIQNMELGHLPRAKTIGIQTQEMEELSKDMGVQTFDEIDDSPKDVSVQTPREVEVQTIDDLSIIASDDEDFETHADAFSQTMSDDESGTRDVEIQTPRDIGVQTPRTVSIQTSDISEEEEEEPTTSVAVQTADEPEEEKRVVPTLDIHTSVWSNTRQTESSFSLSSSEDEVEYEYSTNKKSNALSLLKGYHADVSDDEEIDLPAHLTEPFPKRNARIDYDKLKRTSTGNSKDVSTSTGQLTDHSARQLLERETISTYQSGDSSVVRSVGTMKQLSPSRKGHLLSKPAISKVSFRSNNPEGEVSTETGTQFDSEYHLELQRREDRVREISESLEFTPIETHSFDPGSKFPHSKSVPKPQPTSARDILSKNAFIKDLDLGPLPAKTENWFDRHLRELREVSPPRQRLVKSVNFRDTPLDNYKGSQDTNYVFFKQTANGSKYESFKPQEHRSIMKPYNSYTSPSRTSVARPRPSSAPAVPKHQDSPKSHLTPTLSHLRKQAIRKSVTDSTRSVPRSKPVSTSGCQRSDTFISSTNPPPPLTLPLSNALPLGFPESPSPDEGTFESLGNQPRFISNLRDSSNTRPSPRKFDPRPAVSYRYDDKKPQLNSSIKTESSTTSKPPIPRGRKQERERRTITPRTWTRETASSRSTETSKTRSRSADGPRVLSSFKKINDKERTRDQGTDTIKRSRSASRDKGQTRVTIGRKGEQNAAYYGNDMIQKLIERSGS